MRDLIAQMQPNNVFTGNWWRGDQGYDTYDWQLIHPAIAVTIAAILTLGLYSLLYRENKFYRLVEHIFVGLAAGVSMFKIVEEVLWPKWWVPMVGRASTGGLPMISSHWIWAALLPIGLLAFFVFSRKNAWLSRIPIGIIIGLWAGQQLNAFYNRYLPQITDTARPIIPNEWALAQRDAPAGALPWPQALNNLIIVVAFIMVLSYFLYSFEQKNKVLQKSATAGRWLLMVGFGVIFGTTMMTRFVLFIDRAYFLLVDWLKIGLPN
ncbi:MAG: hypothetical protein M3R13_01295 [Armatimonadota bacterium]|nr:hypothetical protein [Armatimonadota bacterium]